MFGSARVNMSVGRKSQSESDVSFSPRLRRGTLRVGTRMTELNGRCRLQKSHSPVAPTLHPGQPPAEPGANGNCSTYGHPARPHTEFARAGCLCHQEGLGCVLGCVPTYR